MGNQLLIKSVGIVALGLTLAHAEITINDIDKLVNDIKQERIGLTKQDIAKAKDPFIYLGGKYSRVLAGKSKKRHYRFTLTAIINDRVKLNRKWYSLNQTIHGYKISKVGKNYALLTRGNEKVRVYMRHKKSKNIKLFVK
ncbi:hypothetical protein [Hydrogenimonas sp. SS33]|uniref:hypothetical protein n=1 Tax=Hydrogenimonas leucolamina TaxID=2954236 RepID=UPI00336C2C48